MRLGDYQFDRKKARKLGASGKGRPVHIKAFVGRTSGGTYWARACISGSPNRSSPTGGYKSGRRALRVLKQSLTRCSRDMRASTPREAIRKALRSLSVNMGKPMLHARKQ